MESRNRDKEFSTGDSRCRADLIARDDLICMGVVMHCPHRKPLENFTQVSIFLSVFVSVSWRRSNASAVTYKGTQRLIEAPIHAPRQALFPLTQIPALADMHPYVNHFHPPLLSRPTAPIYLYPPTLPMPHTSYLLCNHPQAQNYRPYPSPTHQSHMPTLKCKQYGQLSSCLHASSYCGTRLVTAPCSRVKRPRNVHGKRHGPAEHLRLLKTGSERLAFVNSRTFD